ncbi:MAG: DNA-3-methyladenine glycosylase I [Pseudomonadales bacterium]
MRNFEWIYQHALERKGDREALEALLPLPISADELVSKPDSYFLSAMTWRIFCAGLNRKMIDNKWPAFEEVFFGFDPQKLVLMSDEMLENTLQDTRLVRHWGKIKSIRTNAAMLLELGREKGGFGRFIAEWPEDRIVDLWLLLAKQGAQLGGNSGAYFLRIVEKDTFILTNDVVAALKAQKIVDKKPASKRDLNAVQEAFNAWHRQSDRPLCQISQLLSFCAN